MVWTHDITDKDIVNGIEEISTPGKTVITGSIRLEGRDLYTTCTDLSTNTVDEFGEDDCEPVEKKFGTLLAPTVLQIPNYQYIY